MEPNPLETEPSVAAPGAVVSPGSLYVVATPIGHPDDITLRALKVLHGVDLVAAEDTRTAARLLSRHGIGAPLWSVHEHNEADRAEPLLEKLRQGKAAALISEAGTPSVSDPGYRLVVSAVAAGIPVVPVPGVSAAVAALSVSGLPTDSFLFVGFPPKRTGKRMDLLRSLADQRRTLVFYESPRRIRALLTEAQAVLGDRPAVVAREMTKRHEEFLRGRLSEIDDALSRRSDVKGECTLLIAGQREEAPLAGGALEDRIRTALEEEDAPLSDLSKRIARRHGLPKRTVYETALRIKNQAKNPPPVTHHGTSEKEI